MGKVRAVARERIVDCAIRLFSENGFENVSLGDVSSAAGVDKATVSRNFGDRNGLCEAVAERAGGLRLDVARLDACLSGGLGYDEALVALLTCCFHILFEHIHFLRLYFLENSNQEARRFQLPFREEMQRYLTAYFRKNGEKASEGTLETTSDLLLGFVIKSAWKANFVEGYWTCTDALLEEFTGLVQPQMDSCLMTLLSE